MWPIHKHTFIINQKSRIVMFKNRKCVLQPRVLNVLNTLLSANGEPVSRETLLEDCWDGNIVSGHALSNTISKLRFQLQNLTGENHIQTIPKSGYQLTDIRNFAICSKRNQHLHDYKYILGYSSITALCLLSLYVFNGPNTQKLTLHDIQFEYNNEIEKTNVSELFKKNGWQVIDDK